MEDMKLPVHVEVELKPDSLATQEAVEAELRDKFQKSYPLFREGVVDISSSEALGSDVSRVTICDMGCQEVPFWKAELLFYVYRNIEGEPEKDYLEGEDELPACDQWELPNQALSRLWESIVVEQHIKTNILGYATSAMIFTAAMVDPDIISWNRMILLHGPPGSGKTTLCKAIAQKVFIRNMADYESGFLLEVNSHSLFSKWFSESGKLVMKLFDHINEIADDPQSFVCILIDEVESISSNRSSSMSSNEPGDAVRVVNAVLTSLDALKRKPNVLVLCTSNMQSAIDPAFLDRVDLQVYLGPPSAQARYSILRSCLQELSEKKVISPPCVLAADPPHQQASASGEILNIGGTKIDNWAASTDNSSPDMVVDPASGNTLDTWQHEMQSGSSESKLLDIAMRCEGYSGRSLRKLPLKAHAMYLQRKRVSLDQYLKAIMTTISHDKLEEKSQL